MENHRVWKIGSDIDTDVLAPGAYMKFGVPTIAAHCLEGPYPGLAEKIKSNDVLVAGPNFGIGSSREQAVAVLLHLGVKAVIAPSFSGLYFRNAFNLGLLALECADADQIPDQSYVFIDLTSFTLTVYCNQDQNTPLYILKIKPIPDFLIQLINDGGLLKQLEQTYEHRKGNS